MRFCLGLIFFFFFLQFLIQGAAAMFNKHLIAHHTHTQIIHTDIFPNQNINMSMKTIRFDMSTFFPLRLICGRAISTRSSVSTTISFIPYRHQLSLCRCPCCLSLILNFVVDSQVTTAPFSQTVETLDRRGLILYLVGIFRYSCPPSDH